MASKNVIVTKFNVDDVHLSVEDIGKITTDSQKPVNLVSKKVAAQLKKAGDVNVSTDTKLQKAIADAKKKFGFVGEYVEEGKGKVAFVKGQADAVKKKANELSSAGRGAYKKYYEDPISYVKSSKGNILNQVRSVAGIKFKIDDLLIGEGARRLLMRAIGEVCGTSNLSPFTEIAKAYKDLINILDNINLFSNSDLFNAIGKCDRFSDDHTKIISAKTSETAETGNAEAYAAMVEIPGVRSTDDDIKKLISNIEDTPSSAAHIKAIHASTGRPIKSTIISEVPQTSELSTADPVDVIDASAIQKMGNKQEVVKMATKELNLAASPKLISNATSTLVPPAQGASKEQLALKDMVIDRLSNPIAQAAKIKLARSIRLSGDASTDMGPVKNVNTAKLIQSTRKTSISDKVPSSWSGASTQTVQPASTKSLDEVDPIIETKRKNVTYVHTEEPTVNTTPRKTYAEQVPWLHLTPEDSLVVKSIKSWKTTVNKTTGEELMIPVY